MGSTTTIRERVRTPGRAEWAHVARPQDGGFDTAVALAAARSRGWQRDAPTVRGHRGPAIFDARVAIRPLRRDDNTPAGLPCSHPADPGFAEAAAHLQRLWPEAAAQFAGLVSIIYAVDIAATTRIGYSSNHWITGPFTVALTHFDAIGTAEGMAHELAHLKLLYLGVPREGRSTFLRNAPGELYPSPVRGCDRPITAVLHALYSWVYMLELDLRLLGEQRERALQRIARNRQWVLDMRRTLDRSACWTRAGEAWYAGLSAWIDELADRSNPARTSFPVTHH